MATSAKYHEEGRGYLAAFRAHHEHLRRMRLELAHTSALIQSGAAAFNDSMKLLSRLERIRTVQTDGDGNP